MESEKNSLPQIVLDYVEQVIRNVKYKRKIRQEVKAELLAHFEDALRGVKDDSDKQKKAEELIRDFGDAKLLATLIRRSKKRCRPMWQKALFAVLKVVGIIFAICLLRIGYMAAGRPVISVDYAQWMNEQVRADRDEPLNAYADYQKAIELLQKEMPAEIKKIDNYPPDQQKTPEDWQAIEQFLKTEAEAIEAFRRGASKPYYWNHYKTPKIASSMAGVFTSEILSEVMPQTTEYKKIGQRMASFQIPLAIHQGDIGQAIDDSIALYRFGQHISNQGLAIESLVGLALISLSTGVIADSLIQAELSSADLFRLQQTIQAGYDPSTAIMDWSLEKALWYDEIQRSFTNDGQGNGRVLLRGIPFAVTNNTDSIKGFFVGFPNRKEIIQLIDNAFDRYDELRKITPYNTLHLKKERTFWDTSDTLFFMQIEGPAVQKTIQISWRTRSAQAGLIGTLSVLRFQKENGRIPESLEELQKKGFLAKMPMDPFSDKPLVYRKTDDGFTLYSVGFNFVDDGGILGKDNQGKPTQWSEQGGDSVFWPVSKE